MSTDFLVVFRCSHDSREIGNETDSSHYLWNTGVNASRIPWLCKIDTKLFSRHEQSESVHTMRRCSCKKAYSLLSLFFYWIQFDATRRYCLTLLSRIPRAAHRGWDKSHGLEAHWPGSCLPAPPPPSPARWMKVSASSIKHQPRRRRLSVRCWCPGQVESSFIS